MPCLPIIEIEHTSAAMSQTSCIAVTTGRVDAIVIQLDTTHDNDRWRWEKSASNRVQCILCVPPSPLSPWFLSQTGAARQIEDMQRHTQCQGSKCLIHIAVD